MLIRRRQCQDRLLNMLTGNTKECINRWRFTQSYLEMMACINLAARLLDTPNQEPTASLSAVTSILAVRSGRLLCASTALWRDYLRELPQGGTNKEFRVASIFERALTTEQSAELATRYVQLRCAEEMRLCGVVVKSLCLSTPWTDPVSALQDVNSFFNRLLHQGDIMRRLCCCDECSTSKFPPVRESYPEFCEVLSMLGWPTRFYLERVVQQTISNVLLDAQLNNISIRGGGETLHDLLLEFFVLGENLKKFANEAALKYYYGEVEQYTLLERHLAADRKRLVSIVAALEATSEGCGHHLLRKISACIKARPGKVGDLMQGAVIASHLRWNGIKLLQVSASDLPEVAHVSTMY